MAFERAQTVAKYQNLHEIVDAYPLAEDVVRGVDADGNDIVTPAGFWVITHSDGSGSTLDPDTFSCEYSPLPAGEAKTGRPSRYTKKLADEICERIENGESLREICASPGMPARSTVSRWLGDNEDFRNRYAQARNIHTDDEFDGLAKLDAMLIAGVIKADAHRALVDAKKWRIMKRHPQKYGDKLDVNANLSGEIGLVDVLAKRRDVDTHGKANP